MVAYIYPPSKKTTINPSSDNLTPKGSWNADTNTPTLVSSVGIEGDFYAVSVPGATTLDGISDWEIGDWALFANGVWNKSDNSSQWIDDGDELTTLNNRHVKLLTGKEYRSGNSSKMSEVSGNLEIENTSGSQSILIKLNNVVVGLFNSAKEAIFGESGTPGLSAVRDSSDVEQEIINAEIDNYGKGLWIARQGQSLDNDADVTVSSGKAGIGLINIGDNDAYAFVSFSTTVVTLVSSTPAKVSNVKDNAGTLNIYYDGASLKIQNKLAVGTLTMRNILWNS